MKNLVELGSVEMFEITGGGNWEISIKSDYSTKNGYSISGSVTWKF